MRILVVEDEAKVANFIRQALEQAGMTVDAVRTYADFMSLLKTSRYDVLVLDRLIPGHDLADALPEIRRTTPASKILVLSALSEAEEKVRGLTEGADDYLGKPFHVAELIARIRTLLRREGASSGTARDTVLSYGPLKIDLETQRVLFQDRKVDITAKEYRLLCLLARHPGKVFSKMEILDQVWDMNHFPESNVVEVTMASLRSKIDKKSAKGLIHSRRGAGYWLGEP